MTNGKIVGVLVGGVCLGAALGVGVTRTLLKSPSVGSTAANTGSCSVEGAGAGPVGLFEVDGKTFKSEDLPAEVQDQLFQIQSQMHDSSAGLLKEVALRYALAADKKIDTKDGKNLPDAKSLLGAKKVTEEEMKAFFDANKNGLPPGTTYEQVRGQLEQYMQERQGAEQVRLEVENFEKKGRLKILSKAPIAPLVNLELTGLPFKGAENSKVVVVEASDYLCPHCRHAIDEVEKVLKEYSGKVKFVQANFALRPTGLSGALVRGAWCANKQGNDAFWKYHEKAFAVPQEAATPVSPNTEKAFADTAIKVAQDAGINVKDFETCLASEDSKKGMEANNSKLTSVGVTGTPTFFVNNRKIGAPGNLSSAISAEIEKISANPSKAN
ncbi:MAG: hypothetical protein RIR26_1849 [Pseudomonadota bacterium]